MINKLCFYIALINYIVFYSKTKGLKFHFWMSQGKTWYQFEENDPSSSIEDVEMKPESRQGDPVRFSPSQ